MARVYLSESWITISDISTQQHKLMKFLNAHKMSITNRQGTEIFAKQGSQFLTRMFGGWLVPATWIPKCANVRIHQTEKGVLVEAHIEESLGLGILDDFFKKKYQTYFGLWMNDLKNTIR